MRKPRILVAQQGCIPIYRESFFQRLNMRGAINYVVVHGPAPRGTDLILANPPFDFPNLPVKNYEIRIAGRSCIWQPIVWRAIKGEFDGAVFGDEVKFVSSVIATVALRLRGRPVLFWGFGFHQYFNRQEALLARVTATLAAQYKKILYRLISGYLVYTKGGEQALRDLATAPKRIVVLRNTIDTEREAKFRAAVAVEPLDMAFRSLGVRPERLKLLYFGRFLPEKCVDLLVEYAKRCMQVGRKVDVIIFGQGVEEARLRELAQNLSNVAFHRHDNLLLARALRISAAIVIPGFVGLAVTHGFIHGVPILTRHGQAHSPEVEYLEHSVNGLMLPEAPEEFFAALDAFVDNPDLQRRLAEGAERSGRMINMDDMVAAFDGLVQSVLRLSARPSKQES